MIPAGRVRYTVYVAAATIVCGITLGLSLSVPEEVAHYVSNGLMLPAFRYGLLFTMIACGMVLSGERSPLALAAHLAILASAVWFGLHGAEAIVVSYEALAELIVLYPVLTTAMGVITGAALLVPVRARRWLVPFVSAGCGLGLGLFVILESPFDYYSDWFSSSGGLGGMAVVIASSALADVVKRAFDGSWFPVAERIVGSWLIAASVMLAALAVVAKRPLDFPPMPTISPDDIDVPQQR